MKTQISLDAQSDQSLRCPHEETLGPSLPSAQRRLIRLGGCPGWSESSLGAQVILLVLSWGGSNITFVYSNVLNGQSDVTEYFHQIISSICHRYVLLVLFLSFEIQDKWAVEVRRFFKEVSMCVLCRTMKTISRNSNSDRFQFQRFVR